MKNVFFDKKNFKRTIVLNPKKLAHWFVTFRLDPH